MSNQDSLDNKTFLTEHQQQVKNQATIHRVLNRLFAIYSDSEEFKSKFSISGYNDRSLLLTVVKDPLQGTDIHEIAYNSYNTKDVVKFGARFHDKRLEQYNPDDQSLFTVFCFMDQDTFIDLLLGEDKYHNPFDINDAWGRKWIAFDGKDWLVHKEILSDMFTEFRYLLNIKTIFK